MFDWIDMPCQSSVTMPEYFNCVIEEVEGKVRANGITCLPLHFWHSFPTFANDTSCHGSSEEIKNLTLLMKEMLTNLDKLDCIESCETPITKLEALTVTVNVQDQWGYDGNVIYFVTEKEVNPC